MARPCFLVIDREHSGAISTRKLVIETAKFNVITAYSAEEAIDTLRKFPAVDGIVMDVLTPGTSCQDLVNSLRAINPSLSIVAILSPRSGSHCPGADYIIDSFEPKPLLDILEKIKPAEMKSIKQEDARLAAEEGR